MLMTFWRLTAGHLALVFGLTLPLDGLMAQQQSPPLRGFVALEPFEVRVEALCAPSAYRAEWGLTGDVITPLQKDQILARTLELLRTQTALRSQDFEDFRFDSTQARFVAFTKDLGYVPDDREEIPLAEAMVGVSMSSLCRDVNQLDVAWGWIAPGETQVPVQLSAGSDNLGRFLSRSQPVLSWTRTQGTSSAPQLLVVPKVEKTKREHHPILLKTGIGILALAALLVLILKTKTPPVVFFLIPLGVVALVGAIRFAQSVPVIPNKEKAEEMVYSLLKNTYHAFDFRDESDIYEVLEHSIEGPLLEVVYLEIRKGLEMELKGGPRVRVGGVDLRDCTIIAKNDDAGTFDVQSSWIAIGNVNHWGHSHIRTNQYKAVLRLSATREEVWKISKMQILDEVRTQQVSPVQPL